MKALLAGLVIALLLASPGAARGGPAPPKINVLVVVPSAYTSNVTPAQAVSAAQTFLGQPSDAACIGVALPSDPSTWTCSIEGWFKHELGRVFDYQIQIVPIAWASGGPFDACGASGGPLYLGVNPDVSAATGLTFTDRERDILLVMGAGGWAGHFSPADRKVPHEALIGDWGVMEQFGVPNSCIPDWDYPARGFSHEFMGMMGAYTTSGYDEGGLFIGDPMSAHIKADLLRYSGKWLYGG